MSDPPEPGAAVALADDAELITFRTGEAPEPDYTDIDHSITRRTADAIAGATPANTSRAYDRAWKEFAKWCASEGRVMLPATAQTLAEYVRVMTEKDPPPSPATIKQAMGVIRARHRDNGYPKRPGASAALKLLKKYRKDRADAGDEVKKRSVISVDDLRAMVATCDLSTAAGLRDRAILLLGFAMMARRSDLANRNLSDLGEPDEEGMSIRIAYSKTDQDGDGTHVMVPWGRHQSSCPVYAVGAWQAMLAERGFTSGALFRPVDKQDRIGGEPDFTGKSRDRLSGQGIDAIIRKRAALARLNKASTIGSHSLRSSSASAAYRAGVPVSEIARHGRWAPNSPVVLGYIRAVDAGKHNPMKGIL